MDIQFPQILFQIVNFGVVAGGLTYLLYKPIRKMLKERSDRIEEAQKAAEVTLAERKKIEDIKEKARLAAEKEAQKIVDEARRDAENLRAKLKEKARAEAAAEYEKTLEFLKQEEAVRMKNMEMNFAKAVIAAVRKITGVSLSEKDHQKILAQEAEQLLKHI